MKARFFLPLILALLGAAGVVQAERSSDWYAGLLGSVVVNDPSRALDQGYGAHALFGFPYRPGLAVETNLFFHNSDFEVGAGDVDTYGLGLDLNWHRDGQPFYLAGVGARRDDFSTFEEELLFANLGVGVTVPQWSQGQGRLRAEARYIAVFDDQTVKGDQVHHDFRFNIGFMFGGTRSGSGVRTETAAAADADRDGVADADDECPGTAAGLAVDDAGCVRLDSFVIKGVGFDTGSDRLKAQAKRVLDSATAALKKNDDVTVEIGGHTDNVGGDAANQKLSQKRAESVRAYLMQSGVPGDRLSAKGYGASTPVADNATADGRANNRRVEFKILKQ